MSAAASVTLALGLLLAAMVGLPVGGWFAWHWHKARQAAQRLEQARNQAQVYTALQGVQPTPAAPRPARPAQPQGTSPAVIIVGGQPYQSGGPWGVMQ